MTTERIPPHSQDAEQALLGAILLDSNCVNRITEILAGERDFYLPGHRKIYSAAVHLVAKSQPADITTVSEELERRGELTDCGGRSYLAGLASGVATVANADYYAGIVFEKSQLRRAIEAATDIINQAYRQEKEPSEILDEAEAAIYAITDRRDRQAFRSIFDMIPDLVSEISVRQEAGGGLVGTSTGYADIDRVLSGAIPGDLIILAARPSMGKSALAVNMAEAIAKAKGEAVAFFSLEMTGLKLALRAFAGHAGLNPRMAEQGRLNHDDWTRLMETAAYWEKVPILIDATSVQTPMSIRGKLRRLTAERPVGLVVVDYLQLMSPNRKLATTNDDVASNSRAMKAIAKDFNVPVLLLSQLSRAVEMRGGSRRPQLSDLRDSGAIEQDADVVMFIHREEYYLHDCKPDDPKLIDAHGKADIIIAKQRNGETGVVKLRWDKERVRFENLAREHQEAAF